MYLISGLNLLHRVYAKTQLAATGSSDPKDGKTDL